MVGITPETMKHNNQKVQKILTQSGYYLSEIPSEKSNIHYGIHQSTYDGNGIPEI